jgi:competence protein ComEA
VAARVRELMGGADVEPAGDGQDAWLPGERLDVTPARHAAVPSPVREVPRFSLSRLRWEPDRRTAIAVGLVVLLAAAVTLWWVLSARPRAMAVHQSSPGPPVASAAQPTLSSSATPSSGPTSARSQAANVVVDVAGRVRHPGVYRLASGSRVVDAVRAAGGTLPGVSTVSLNLAEPLRDGQQVIVGIGGIGGAPGTGGVGAADPGSSGGGSPPGVVDLNTATLEQLQTLPGVGPVLAQHILDWRTQHGTFTSVDQLNDVTGIGDVKFAALRPLVSV